MLSLKDDVERGPELAGSRRYRPTMGLGRESRHAHGLRRLRALSDGSDARARLPGK